MVTEIVGDRSQKKIWFCWKQSRACCRHFCFFKHHPLNVQVTSLYLCLVRETFPNMAGKFGLVNCYSWFMVVCYVYTIYVYIIYIYITYYVLYTTNLSLSLYIYTYTLCIYFWSFFCVHFDKSRGNPTIPFWQVVMIKTDMWVPFGKVP